MRDRGETEHAGAGWGLEPHVRGRARFVDDVAPPGTLHARVVRSPVAHARLLSIDTTEAERVPGVHAVVTAHDLGPLADGRIPTRGPAPSALAPHGFQPVLASERVRYVGEPVAVVVARDPYVAEDAAELVLAEYDELPAVVDPQRAAAGGPLLHDDAGTNVLWTLAATHGAPAEQALAAADMRLRRTFRTHRHMAAALETRGLVAQWDDAEQRVTVWGATKVKHANRDLIASLLGLPADAVRLVETDVGGSFGARGELYPEDVLVPWLARRLGAPVKWIEDRYESFVSTNHSREFCFDVELGLAGDGTFRALRVEAWCALGAYVRTTGDILARLALIDFTGPYVWPSFEGTLHAVVTNATGAGTYRGPGATEGAFARERLLDCAAHALGLDPAELRARNLVPPEQMPYRVDLGPGVHGLLHDRADYPAMLRDVLERAGYDEARAAAAAARGRGERAGVGVSCFVEGVAFGPFEDARIAAGPDGGFTASVGSAASGQGTDEALATIVARILDVEPQAITVEHHDTDAVPAGMGSWASRTTVVVGNAVGAAARQLVDDAVAAARARLGEDAVLPDVRAGCVRMADGSALPIAELVSGATARFVKEDVTISFGANVAEVQVDDETGSTSVTRLVVGYDVGAAVVPELVHGQLVGAAAQGLGGALLEELVYDDDGQPRAVTLADYKLPTAGFVPPIDAIAFEYPAENPLGAKGAGEGGIVGTLAAVGNAVADAIGDPDAVDALPLTPRRVWELIHREEPGGTRLPDV